MSLIILAGDHVTGLLSNGPGADLSNCARAHRAGCAPGDTMLTGYFVEEGTYLVHALDLVLLQLLGQRCAEDVSGAVGLPSESRVCVTLGLGFR